MKTTNFLFGSILLVGIIIMAARFMISADVERQIAGLEKRLEARLGGAAMAASGGGEAGHGSTAKPATASAAPAQQASAAAPASASTPAKQPAAPIQAADKGGRTDTPSNQAVASGGTNAAPGGATAGPEPVAPLLAAASPERGKNVARACAACHTFDKGGANRVGPNLWGVVGADKAAHAGYSYSAALTGLPGSWEYEDLNAYLWKPAAYAKGTKMVYAGLPKPQDRADVIAFLRSLHDSPPPLPGGAQPAAASGGSAQPTPTPTPTPAPTTSGGSSSQSGTAGSRAGQEAGAAAAMPGGSGASPSSGPASPVAGSGSTGASASDKAGAPAGDDAAKPPSPAANASPGRGGDGKETEPARTQGAVDKERMTGPSGTPQ